MQAKRQDALSHERVCTTSETLYSTLDTVVEGTGERCGCEWVVGRCSDLLQIEVCESNRVLGRRKLQGANAGGKDRRDAKPLIGIVCVFV